MDAITQFGHESIKKGSKSFALASRVLPPALRDDASMLYAWCRFCDDVIDGQEMGHGQLADYKTGQKQRLAFLKKATQDVLTGKPTDNPVFAGLARVVKTHEIDHRHPFDLLKGFEMDAEDRVYKTVDDIDDATLDRASDLGLAFQLTNISRDVVDDARAGRVFIPQDLLKKHGAPIDAHELVNSDNWPAAYRAALEQLDIAEAYYRSAKVGIKALPFRCAWAISAALAVYREIGEMLRRRGPEAWAGRVSASKGKKLGLAIGAAGPAIRRANVAQIARDGFYQRPI